MIKTQPSNSSNIDKKTYRLFEKFCSPGVYALVNEKDKRIFISHSSNILSSSARVISQVSNKVHPIKQMYRDRKRLKVVLLEVETFKPARLMKLEQQILKYLKNTSLEDIVKLYMTTQKV